MSKNEYSTNNQETGFSPPVPESLRPAYRQTYISPEENEAPKYSQETPIPPQTPPNASYQYNINSFRGEEPSEYPEIPPVDSYNTDYVQNTPSQPLNYRQKERTYIKPISEQEYERERRKENKAPRSNITPQPEKQQQNKPALFQNNFKWVAWVILFLIIFLIVF